VNDIVTGEKVDRAGPGRKKVGFIVKAGLAVAILLVILANVKVRDHLTLPAGVPHAGTHAGWFESDGGMAEETLTFRMPDFLFAATLKEGKIIAAEVANPDGTVYSFSAKEIEGIDHRVGLVSTLKKMHLSYWGFAILIYFAAISITSVRWSLLLKATDLPQRLIRAYRLTFIGIFFNNVVPGQTGGDLIRAYYIARENKARRTDSVSTVIVDRILGITALALIAAAVIPTDIERYGANAAVIYGFLGIFLVCFLVYFSKRLRRLFRLAVLLKKLPFQEFFQKIDRSFFIYRYRKSSLLVCFMMSFGVHLLIIASIWVAGRGLGIDLPFTAYLANIPIIFILSSIPITPAGWGVGEALFVLFFRMVGVEPVQAMALSLLFRTGATFISLLGGVFLLMEKERIKPDEMDLEMESSLDS
jgi:uncharacterized protein (TIRG00374 family)